MDRKEAIERIQEVMTIIKTQHMCKDMDGECTTEDRETYIQRFEALRMAIEALQEPQVGGWIPVTERLPEDGYGVLVTVNGKHNNITFVNALEIAEYGNTEGWIIEGYLDWLDPNVIAWQPLPEPYKEERTNDSSRNQQEL